MPPSPGQLAPSPDRPALPLGFALGSLSNETSLNYVTYLRASLPPGVIVVSQLVLPAFGHREL